MRLLLLCSLLMAFNFSHAERYVPSKEEVENYQRAMSPQSGAQEAQLATDPSVNASDRLRGLAMGMRALDLTDDDEAQILLALNRYGELEQKSARQVQTAVCKQLAGIDDVRTIDPEKVFKTFDKQADKLNDAGERLYEKMMAKLSSDGREAVSTFLDDNLTTLPTYSSRLSAATSRAGSATVPLFAMQERCYREAGLGSDESTTTGVTK